MFTKRDPPASLAQKLCNCLAQVPGPLPNLGSEMPCAGGYSYSTTKGADCAISCFEIVSFTLIVTLYFPGCRPAIGKDFSTVNWSLCAPRSLDSSSFSKTTEFVAVSMIW